MKITGKVHCFFEQSGTFKNEFKKLGINAIDYDIKNEFGNTDNVIDLFSEIEKAYSTLTSNKQQATSKRIRHDRSKSRFNICFFPLHLFL